MIYILVILPIIEALWDVFLRSKGGKFPVHGWPNVLLTFLVYLIACIWIGQGKEPDVWYALIFVVLMKASYFDLVYNALVGERWDYVSDKWYDRWKKKIPKTLLVVRIIVFVFGIVFAYIIAL